MNIVFDVTEFCNFNCAYCYVPDTSRKIFLDGNIFRKIIATATTPDSTVTLTGGEPMLHPDFSGLLEACRHLRTRIFTNGSRIGNHWDALVSARPVLHVSFHGFDAKVRDNVKRLLEAGFETVAHVVLTEENAGRLERIVEFFGDVPAFIFLFPTRTATNGVALVPETVWRQRLELARRRLDGTRKNVFHESAYGSPDAQSAHYCSAEHANFVAVDGRIYDCCFMPAFAGQEKVSPAPVNRSADCPMLRRNPMPRSICPLYVEPLDLQNHDP